MTEIHANEIRTLKKHFFTRKREREREQNEKEKRNPQRSDADAQKGSSYALKVIFSIAPLFGDLCIHIPAPDKRNKAALEPAEPGAEEAREERSMIDGVLVGL